MGAPPTPVSLQPSATDGAEGVEGMPDSGHSKSDGAEVMILESGKGMVDLEGIPAHESGEGEDRAIRSGLSF